MGGRDKGTSCLQLNTNRFYILRGKWGKRGTKKEREGKLEQERNREKTTVRDREGSKKDNTLYAITYKWNLKNKLVNTTKIYRLIDRENKLVSTMGRGLAKGEVFLLTRGEIEIQLGGKGRNIFFSRLVTK